MTISKTKGMSYAVALAAVTTLAAACGSSSSGAASGGSQSVSSGSGGGSTASSNTKALTTQSTSIGTVVADAKGRTVYELVGDPVSNTKCNTACLSVWPAVMSGGKIAVVHGHPVFTFAGDSAKGQTNGEGKKDTWGLWLALNPKGQPISASAASAPAPSQSAASGGGGGYGY
jgi:predicted lipoprotein with Yx(FWY)xxD motif